MPDPFDRLSQGRNCTRSSCLFSFFVAHFLTAQKKDILTNDEVHHMRVLLRTFDLVRKNSLQETCKQDIFTD